MADRIVGTVKWFNARKGYGNLIGSVRGYIRDETCYIGRLIVQPEFQNQGIGTRLVDAIENHFKGMPRFEIFTGEKSERNLYLYQKLGYQIYQSRQLTDRVNLFYLEKVTART